LQTFLYALKLSAMKAKITFGMLCALGAMTPVAFAGPAVAKEAAATAATKGYSVSFSGGG